MVHAIATKPVVYADGCRIELAAMRLFRLLEGQVVGLACLGYDLWPLAGIWCQIARKVEGGETAWQAALRELYEETGLAPDAFYSADICEQFYEADRDAITVAPVFVAFIDSAAEVY